MKPVLALIALLGLAACGVDGPPERPAAGVNVSGDVTLGVSSGV